MWFVEHDAGQVGAEVRQMFFRRLLALRTAFDGGGLRRLGELVLPVFCCLSGGAFLFFLVGAAFEKMSENDIADGFQRDVAFEEARPRVFPPEFLPVDRQIMECAVDVASECVAVGERIDGHEKERFRLRNAFQRSDDDVSARTESAENRLVETGLGLGGGDGGDEIVRHRDERGVQTVALAFAAAAVVEADGGVAVGGERPREIGQQVGRTGPEAAPTVGEDDDAFR